MTPKENINFTKGIEYRMIYENKVRELEIIGNFEYIGTRGSKLHFFENYFGLDILISKATAINGLVNGK